MPYNRPWGERELLCALGLSLGRWLLLSMLDIAPLNPFTVLRMRDLRHQHPYLLHQYICTNIWCILSRINDFLPLSSCTSGNLPRCAIIALPTKILSINNIRRCLMKSPLSWEFIFQPLFLNTVQHVSTEPIVSRAQCSAPVLNRTGSFLPWCNSKSAKQTHQKRVGRVVLWSEIELP